MNPKIGDYTLVERLGRGGFGVAWRAVGPAGETVALKVMHAEYGTDTSQVNRFLGEFAVLMRLDHPHIVKVRALLSHECRPVLVMDLVRGRTLAAELRRRGALPEVETVRLIQQVCSALSYAHEAGVVHRDLKPDNLLLEVDSDADPLTGAWSRLRLVDFGIAVLAGAPRHTATGILMGTPSYMAPELIDGEASAATDVYGVGLLMYECMTGRKLFDGGPVSGILDRHRFEEPDLPPDWPARLREVVASCLSKVPANRPTFKELTREFTGTTPSASMMTELLGQHGDLRQPTLSTTAAATVGERRARSPEPIRATSTRSRWVMTLLICVTLVGIAALAVSTKWQATERAAPPGSATRTVDDPTPTATQDAAPSTNTVPTTGSADSPTTSASSVSSSATLGQPQPAPISPTTTTHASTTVGSTSSTTPPRQPSSFTNGTNANIVDGQGSNFAGTSIVVSAPAGLTVGSPNVALVIDIAIVHARGADLTVVLVAPDGARYVLATPNPYDSRQDFRVKADFTKTVRAGTPVSGTWRLEASDSSYGMTGFIDRWAITV